jgi:hypothetical protein
LGYPCSDLSGAPRTVEWRFIKWTRHLFGYTHRQRTRSTTPRPSCGKAPSRRMHAESCSVRCNYSRGFLRRNTSLRLRSGWTLRWVPTQVSLFAFVGNEPDRSTRNAVRCRGGSITHTTSWAHHGSRSQMHPIRTSCRPFRRHQTGKPATRAVHEDLQHIQHAQAILPPC